MKATEVRIQKALEPGESYVDPTFVLVETVLDDGDETTTTIEHLASRFVGGRLRWQVVTLGQSVPMSHAGALEWAVSFAASRNIPIVYQRDESSAAHQAAALIGASAMAPSSVSPSSASK
jgi:hypothetical protein